MNNLTSVITDFLQQNADATHQGNHSNRSNFTEVTDIPDTNQSSNLGNQGNRKKSGNQGVKSENRTEDSCCSDPIKFKVLENQVIRALLPRGDDQENIDQVIIDCAMDYDQSEWLGLFDYFVEIERKYSPKNLTCSQCQHFTPDQVGDGSGIGKCAAGVKRSVLLWPGQQACNHFQVPEVSQ